MATDAGRANSRKRRSGSKLGEQAYIAIKKQILNGVLQPGEQLIETQLAEQLGMSRTPIRNALLRMEHEKLVTSVPNGGTFVASLSPVDVAETYDIREVIEGLAARLLARKITPAEAEMLRELAKKADSQSATLNDDLEFHSAIIKMCGNSRLAELVDMFCLHSMTFDERSRQMVASGNVQLFQTDRDPDAHCVVAEKIIEGDGYEAEERLKLYIRRGKNTLIKVLMGLD